MSNKSKSKLVQDRTVRDTADGLYARNRNIPEAFRSPIEAALRVAYTAGRRAGYDKGVQDEKSSCEAADGQESMR